MLGGDLRFHLDRLGTMPEEYVRFYAAEIALGLNYLHSLNIIHRGYLSSVDWWSMGIVCYELLFGKRPFRGKTNDALQNSILHDSLIFPHHHNISPLAIDFIENLLTRDVDIRIGFGKQGFDRLIAHPWFADIDWQGIKLKKVNPPFVPDNKKANFDPTHELDELQLQDKTPKINMKNSKRNMDASHLDRSRQISNDQELLEQSPERQMMEDKFLAYDYSKPEENENRRRMAEQKHWAQKMNKTTGHSNRKAGGTYKASVLDYLNQKPPPPLTASDILKLEELARSAKANTSKDKTNEWRPPSGLLNYNDMDGFSIEAHADSSYQEARTRSSDDSSCPLVTFPNDSERYLIESAASIEKADEATISMLNDDYVVKYSASVKSTTSNNSYYTKSSRNY
ncbi:hypothetical protein RO3G_08801 [Rhizopus delemar RA 99-880]|uniref:Protein kinase domain-containing protein n=1 Tax=Rhizopus delemar (strain RA 99-880 / ATCC MYA-4621 / FGSC 9543 / NRRL 43880) TaxID=246409 RepID=I1C6L6_RHIO9|nr:hypothetical protein RO3G_08801 [Rhizopus delemar RA 99-880]|eukprot:EIE84096.1 hypothetical protein RO3G_08801 [Rhizopus delemar RA 99-880]